MSIHSSQSIAVIGAGISGLSAAYVLSKHHRVTLYEKENRLGGHARTLTVQHKGKDIAVDTGFIVFNDRNYPHLNALFSELGVPYHKSDMSFAARINKDNTTVFEYSSKSLKGIFPTPRTWLDARRWKMMRDYLRFSRHAKKFIDTPERISLGQLLQRAGVSESFTHHFILPMGAAIWSCPVQQMLEYPAATFVRFFYNHGLLDYNGQPQWYTVTGGSREYVERIRKAMKADMKTNCAATRVERTGKGVRVQDVAGGEAIYDQVIFACHADEALAMHADISPEEKAVISAFRFNENIAYLHSDITLMPKQKACWASWVYLSETLHDASPTLAITYWMNLLQTLDEACPLFVTLNPAQPPAPELTHNVHHFTHPIFDQAAIDAQSAIPSINGKNRIWWCGAWQRYGFHEDGIHSAMNVVRAMGTTIPWEQA